MITAIFTTVFVSRSKDVLDNIRLRALVHLGDWMITDPEWYFLFLIMLICCSWIEDDYLKYIGWLSSDRSSAVRLASLEILLKLLEVGFPSVFM